MIYQCAPDPDDVLAQRRLSDGRELAVFRLVRYEESVTRRDKRLDHIAGQVIVTLSYSEVSISRRRVEQGYALVITDDTELPEKWRTLDTARALEAIMRRFADFKEGDDDRRTRQVEGHPARRSSDSAPPR
jgi:hypothetical protein